MNIDEVLTRDAEIPPLDTSKYDAARAAVEDAAKADVARLAKVVRVRRGRRVLIGVAAAAVVGVAVVSQNGGGAHPAPLAKSPAKVETVEFKTVAQVIDAASVSAGTGDAVNAAYWKVVNHTTCGGQAGEYPCDLTNWIGLTGPGVLQGGDGKYTAACEGGVEIAGRWYSWPEANRHRWTSNQIATIVADNGSDTPGRPAHSFYVFKNTVGLLSGPASPEIRKELWRQLAAVPGIQFAGAQSDTIGRKGWRLTLGSGVPGYGSQSILVDTATGRLLESSDWVDGYHKNVSTIVSSGPTDSAPALSAGSLKPMC